MMPNMTGFWLTFLMVLFGAFGGCLAVLSLRKATDILENGLGAYGKKWPFIHCLWINAAVGVGGALVFAAVLSLDGKFDHEADFKTVAIVISSAVGAGFVGGSMLKRISAQLLDKAALEDFKNTLGRLTAALSVADEVLATDPSKRDAAWESDRRDVIEQLREIVKQFPERRIAAITIGRLQKAGNDFRGAVTTLEAFIKLRREKQYELSNEERSIYFNLACYNNRIAESLEPTSTAEAEKFRIVAWEHCQTVSKIAPEFIADIATDDDIKSVLKPGVRELASLKA